MTKWTRAPTYRVSLLHSPLATHFALWYPCESHDGHEDVLTPALRRGEEGEDIQLGSWLSHRLPVHSTPKALGLRLLLSSRLQWDLWEHCSSTEPAELSARSRDAGPGNAHAAPKHSATSAPCKHLSAVMRRTFSSQKVTMQWHYKGYQCQCTITDIWQTQGHPEFSLGK